MKTVQDKNLLEMPIGVFDSGMGGLTVMREIMRQIPNEKVIYFGDTARVPYGSKSKETVTRFSRQIVRFLQSKQVKAIVVACNTASAYALNDLEREIDIPIIGVVTGVPLGPGMVVNPDADFCRSSWAIAPARRIADVSSSIIGGLVRKSRAPTNMARRM